MSLIHDALRQPATDTDSGAPSRTHASPPRLLDGRRFPVAWLLAGALVAVPLVFLLPRTSTQPAPAPAPAVSTVMPVAAVIPPSTAPAPHPAAPVDDAAPAMPAPAPLHGITRTTPSPPPAPTAAGAAPASPPAIARVPGDEAATPARAQIQLSVRRQDAAGDKRDTRDETDTVAVRMAMNALNAAVASDDAAGIEGAIGQLQSLLPPQSLTLLRARAWVAHGGGDYAEAERLYRAILDRVPDDETAGVNLALLDARRGNVAEARTRLGQLASRNGRSTQVAQALAELEAAQQ